MNIKELHISFADHEYGLREQVTRIGVSAYAPPDFSRGVEHIKDFEIENWLAVELPNNEVIEIKVIYILKSGRFILDVRQDMLPLLSVVCRDLGTVSFTTSQKKLIMLEIHEPRVFERTNDVKRSLQNEPSFC